MRVSIEELAVMIEGLRLRVKQLASALGAAAGYKVANNLTTTTTGFLLDARQGKTLNSKLSDLCVQPGEEGYTFFGAGYMTADKKQVIVTMPVNKIISGVTPASIVLTEILLVQNGVQIYKTADGIEAVEVVLSTAENALHSGVRMDLYKNSGGSHVVWNNAAIANDPVGIFIRGTITWA